MNCNAVVCVTAGNKLIVVDEIVKQQDTDAMAREIRRRYGNNKIFVYPDASGAAKGQLLTQAKQTLPFWKVMGLLVWPYVATHPSKTGADLQAVLENSKGQIRMAIYAKATRLIECLELQSYDEKTGDPDKQNGYDHLNDVLGYLCYRSLI